MLFTNFSSLILYSLNLDSNGSGSALLCIRIRNTVIYKCIHCSNAWYIWHSPLYIYICTLYTCSCLHNTQHLTQGPPPLPLLCHRYDSWVLDSVFLQRIRGPAGVQRGDDPRVPRLHRQRHLLLRTELRISQPRRLPSQPCKKYSPKESKKKGQFNNLKWFFATTIKWSRPLYCCVTNAA